MQNKQAITKAFDSFLLVLFSFMFVFGSIGTYKATESTIFFNKLFIQSFWKSHFFSLLEITFIIFVLFLIHKFGVSYRKADWKLKLIFWSVIFVFILKMLNPNNNPNNPILGMPLFSDVSNYTFILLAYFSFFLNDKLYMVFLKKTFYYIGIILSIRLFYLSLLWLMGKGNYGFGSNSTLTEGDTLFLIAFYQTALFVLFLNYKKKKYLLLWLVYLLFQIFSYRRSALGVALSANVLSYILILLKRKSIKNKIILISGIIIFFGVINNIDKINLPLKYEDYALRFISAIPGMSMEKNGVYTDTGHWEQTSETFYYAISTLGFWGHGYGKSYNMYLQGQSGVIHNVYAATWALNGIYMLIFYLLIIAIVLYYFLKSFLFEKIINMNYYILKISICSFLLMLFAVFVTNPLIVAETFKMQVFWFTLFAIIIRISQNNTYLLL